MTTVWNISCKLGDAMAQFCLPSTYSPLFPLYLELPGFVTSRKAQQCQNCQLREIMWSVLLFHPLEFCHPLWLLDTSSWNGSNGIWCQQLSRIVHVGFFLGTALAWIWGLNFLADLLRGWVLVSYLLSTVQVLSIYLVLGVGWSLAWPFVAQGSFLGQ
jgi:hypothetical protein